MDGASPLSTADFEVQAGKESRRPKESVFGRQCICVLVRRSSGSAKAPTLMPRHQGFDRASDQAVVEVLPAEFRTRKFLIEVTTSLIRC